jgi:glycosyltransferase involved in cell wall biosynthesis
MGSCVFVISWPPTATGGVNEAVLGLAGALQANAKLKPIIAVASWSPMPLPTSVRGIPVLGLQLHDGYQAGFWAALKSAIRLPSDLVAIYKALRTNNVEVVNLHFPTLGGWVFVLLRGVGLFKGKLALTFHGADIRGANESRWLTRMAWRHLINGADMVFVCSRALATEVRLMSPQTDVRVIYNGADIALFKDIAKIPGSGRKRLLNIAKFEHKKSQDVLLAALQLLLDRGVDCVLTMIGATGPTLDHVRQVAANFSDRVTLLVGVDHDRIPAYMGDCDLFILPSRAEGFPIVLIEAGVAGLPVVATNIAGITEFITDGRTGLLVEPNDPRALADAIQKILENDELARSLASRLRTEAFGFTWQRAAEQFVAALS